MHRHAFDPVSLIAGVLSCTLGVAFLRGADVTAWPWLLIVAGVAAMLATAWFVRLLVTAPARRHERGRERQTSRRERHRGGVR